MRLIPTIEVGKQYLWKPVPSEIICSNCGKVYGNESDLQTRGLLNKEFIVVIIEAFTEVNFGLICAECEKIIHSDGTGWYGCYGTTGEHYGIPYTQLFELEEQDD